MSQYFGDLGEIDRAVEDCRRLAEDMITFMMADATDDPDQTPALKQGEPEES